jgi:hypothetical protein
MHGRMSARGPLPGPGSRWGRICRSARGAAARARPPAGPRRLAGQVDHAIGGRARRQAVAGARDTDAPPEQASRDQDAPDTTVQPELVLDDEVRDVVRHVARGSADPVGVELDVDPSARCSTQRYRRDGPVTNRVSLPDTRAGWRSEARRRACKPRAQHRTTLCPRCPQEWPGGEMDGARISHLAIVSGLPAMTVAVRPERACAGCGRIRPHPSKSSSAARVRGSSRATALCRSSNCEQSGSRDMWERASAEILSGSRGCDSPALPRLSELIRHPGPTAGPGVRLVPIPASIRMRWSCEHWSG